MLLVSIILGFAVLALGLLTLLDRYETAVDKSHADRRFKKAPKMVYYDAFSHHHPTTGHGVYPANKSMH
jgi:hypothetical protein